MDPAPAWEKDAGQQALAGTRGHVDDEACYIADGDRLQMFRDKIYVPVVLEPSLGIEYRPGLAHEIRQRTLGKQSIEQFKLNSHRHPPLICPSHSCCRPVVL